MTCHNPSDNSKKKKDWERGLIFINNIKEAYIVYIGDSNQ